MLFVISVFNTFVNSQNGIMFADLNSSAEVPSRRTLSKLVETSTSEMMVKIKNKLRSLSHICTTADIWSTKHRSFMGVTAHWVTIVYNFFFLSSPIGGASISYFKNFCPRPRIRPRPRVIWFFRTITLESLNQSEPNFHT